MNNNVITPERQKGLMVGALMSAAINALSGKSPREAMAKAAIGSVKAYSGGINSIYDMEQNNLNLERQKDMLEASKQTHIWEQEDRPTAVSLQNLSLSEANRRAREAAEDRPTAVRQRDLTLSETANRVKTAAENRKITIDAATRKAEEDALDLALKRKKVEGYTPPAAKEKKPSSAYYNVAGKYVPELLPEGIDIANRQRIVNELAIELKKNPAIETDIVEMDKTLENIYSKYRLTGQVAKPEGKPWYSNIADIAKGVFSPMDLGEGLLRKPQQPPAPAQQAAVAPQAVAPNRLGTLPPGSVKKKATDGKYYWVTPTGQIYEE